MESCAIPQRGAIVVVAKCPSPGTSKTRLAGLLGNDGSAELAKAMLCDVLMTISHCTALDKILKILVYAPGTLEGRAHMSGILDELQLPHDDDMVKPKHWILCPMFSASNISDGARDLQSTDLGTKLAHALSQAQELLSGSSTDKGKEAGVVFLGMDSPMLPLEEIVEGLLCIEAQQAGGNTHTITHPNNQSVARMCPAQDGGYGMLCVPASCAQKRIFQGVLWSHPLTAVSQCKALTDHGTLVTMGQWMQDIDEPDDVFSLARQLISFHNNIAVPQSEPVNSSQEDRHVLQLPGQMMGLHYWKDIPPKGQYLCPYSWNALINLKVVQIKIPGHQNKDVTDAMYFIDEKLLQNIN